MEDLGLHLGSYQVRGLGAHLVVPFKVIHKILYSTLNVQVASVEMLNKSIMHSPGYCI